MQFGGSSQSLHSNAVGDDVGLKDGKIVGCIDGANVANVGPIVGVADGSTVVGPAVGCMDGI